MKRSNEFFLRGPLLPSILRYTIPIILTGALQLFFNAADLVIVGRYCSSDCVGAVGSTGATTNLVVTLFMGLSIGGGVCVAHALGAGNDKAAHRAVHTALPTALICGSIVTVLGIFLTEPLLKLMGTPKELLPLSKLYMQIYFGGMTFNMVYNYCGSILRAAGDTRSPLIYLCFAGAANVGLNYLFVTQFGMDVDGVALATTLSQGISAVLCVRNQVGGQAVLGRQHIRTTPWLTERHGYDPTYYLFVTQFGMDVDGVALATTLSQGISAVLCVRNLMRRTDACRLELKKMRIYKPELLKMIRIGLPAGIQNGMFSISNVIIQSSINSFGPDFVNGNSAAANIEGFMWVFSNAFQQASLNFVGQNHGANQPKRAAKALWLCLGSAFTVCLTLGLLASYFGETLLGIYITDSPDAIACALIRVARVFPVYFLFGLMDSTTGALRGRGASLAPMLISVVGICGIRLGWIFTIFRIPAYHTPESLYLSFPLSWAITFCGLLIAFLVIARRARREETHNLAAA